MQVDEKLKYLNHLFYTLDKQQTPNQRVAPSYKKDGEEQFGSWISFSDIDQEDEKLIKSIMHRGQLNSEIILEFDLPEEKKGTCEGLQEFDQLIQQLEDDNIKYRAFCTEEGRGMHIETFWDELGSCKKDQRREIREFVINKYGCDLAFASDDHQVSFGEHFKTGKEKKLYKKNWVKEQYDCERAEIENKLKLISQEYQQQKATEEKKGTEELLNNNFIFDERQIHRIASFPLFKINSEIIGIGMTLPAWREIRGNKGQYLGREQREEQVIITSNKKIHRVNLTTASDLGVRFIAIPDEYPRRWKPSAIKEFLIENNKCPNIKQVYAQILKEYQINICQSENWHKVHTLWDIATYFCQLFHAFPYLELRGMRKTGKTKIMEQSSCFSFNASEIMANPSAATLFREVELKRPTLYLDEAESFFRIIKGKVEPDERVEVLNSGYKATGTVPRQEKIGNRFVTTTYHTYSPKMIASINGLRGALESRAIVHITTRAPDNDQRGETEVNLTDTHYQEIRNELYLILMNYWQEILQTYEDLSQENKTTLRKRDFQIWRPILAVAKVIDEKLFSEIIAFAQQQVNVSKLNEIGEGSYEYLLLQEAWELLRTGYTFITLNDLEKALPGETKISRKGLASMVDKFGLYEYKKTRMQGTGYEITPLEFETIISPVLPAIFASFASYSSCSNNVLVEKQEKIVIEDMKEDTNIMKKHEEKQKTVHEANEANEANEALVTSLPLKSAKIPKYSLLLASIEKLYKKGQKKPLSITYLQKMNYHFTDEFFAKAKKKGDLYEPKLGMVGVIE